MNNRFFSLHLHVVPFLVRISRPSLLVAWEFNFLFVTSNCSSKTSDVTLNWPDLTLQLFNFFSARPLLSDFAIVGSWYSLDDVFHIRPVRSLTVPSSRSLQFFLALALTSFGLTITQMYYWTNGCTIGQPFCVILGPSFYCRLGIIFWLQFWGGHFPKKGVRHWSKTSTVKPSP